VPPRAWRELPRLVPALGDMPESAGSRYELLAELEEFLTLAAATRPLLVVLDDMQWADAATWDALEYLVPRLDRQRVLFCLTVRSEDLREDGLERRRRLSRHERFHEISLSRLSRDELAQWLKSVLGGQAPSPEFLDHVATFTEGNPLFAVQTMRSLLEDGRLRLEDGRWVYAPDGDSALPLAVGDLLERRLARLSDRTREILGVAAVLGREFDTDLLIEASHRGEDEVIDAIEAGVAATVVRAVDDRGSRYAFAHALLADVIRRSTNPLRLRRAHERVARVLEGRRADSPEEIALHYDRAGCSDRAYRNALLAGARASGVYAHEEAAGFFEMADRHARTLAESADAQWRLAQVDEAVGRYAEAERRCDLVLSSFAAGAAELGITAPVRRMRKRLHLLLGRPAAEVLAACEELLADAREVANRAEIVSLLNMLSQVHGRLGDWATAERFARDAVVAAEVGGDESLLADAAMRLGTSLLGARPADAVPHYRRALDLFTRLGDRRGQLRCHINVGIACDRAGNHPAAEVSYVTALELGREIMARDLAGVASLNLGVLLMKSGRWSDTRERFEEARRLFAAVNNEPNRLGALYNLAHLARERGDAAGAVELYAATATLAAKLGQLDVRVGALAGGGLAELNLSALRAAREKLAAASELLAARRDWWFQGRELVEALRVRIAAAAGDTDRATAGFLDAVAQAEEHDHYAAVWLAADCASALRGTSPTVAAALDRLTMHARALGYQPLLERLLAASTRQGRADLRVAS
jgi:tetratricopeptide (TPR) repeat protein